jgi:threonine synthase
VSDVELRFQCVGCGTVVDPLEELPFKCSRARAEVHIDHVLEPISFRTEPYGPGSERNPFVRYRHLLSSYQIFGEEGGSDQQFIDMAESLNERIATLDGAGFQVSPMIKVGAEHCAEMGLEDHLLLIKNETGNVSGSHKARHLMSVMLYLLTLERRGSWLGNGLRQRRLAIASCGNAALGAAVIARAADWPLDVFVPLDAAESVLERLRDLGATVHICNRSEGQGGDPCYLAFKEQVAAGSLPFGVQGSDNGLAIEGSKVLGYELAQQLSALRIDLDALFIQVGGGGLASGAAAGLREAKRLGFLQKMPSIYTVQTRGAYPLSTAFEQVRREIDGVVLDAELIEQAIRHAAEHRDYYMKPWPEEPKSIAHGILDDETYDWLSIVRSMLETGGDSLVVDDARVIEAFEIGRRATGVNVCHTGVSGLAGLMDLKANGGGAKLSNLGVLFTGSER